ncbi:MAG: helix-turn-helix transcriptional regulator [Chitinophagaceae bacterium]|nr:helix-turn-helix transcriptional regulator [Chitinophagaceae bacterium]
MVKKKILHFDGLYGDLAPQGKEAYIFLELIKTRSETFDWVVKPHIHSQLYQVFCIESGKVILEASENSATLKPPCIIIIPPGTMHGLRYSPDVKGHILTMSDNVFDELFPGSASLLLHFDDLQVISFEKKGRNDFTAFIGLIEKINAELFGEQAEKQLMLYALLSQLFIALFRKSETVAAGSLKDTNQTLHFYRRFIQLVKNAKSPRSIPIYSKELGISAVHLNRICNQACGKSALLIVQEHLVQQSKNYLAHSSYSISEIAYLLNFEYPNYFARLFKKLNGISPKEYRRMKR